MKSDNPLIHHHDKVGKVFSIVHDDHLLSGQGNASTEARGIDSVIAGALRQRQSSHPANVRCISRRQVIVMIALDRRLAEPS
jgi:hypothetical protein